MPQWRSIRKAAEELKTEDPHAAILEWRIRELEIGRAHVELQSQR